MRNAGWIAAWCVSIAPLALEHAGSSEWSLRPLTTIGWVALVWIVCAGWPAGEVLDDREPAPWVVVALALPPLALAAAFDRAQGASWSSLALHGSTAAAMIGLSAQARAWCRSTARSRAVFAIAWLGVFVSAPALAAALDWGSFYPRSAAASSLESIARASPLRFAFDLAATRASELEVDARAALPAVASVALVLVALARHRADGRPR